MKVLMPLLLLWILCSHILLANENNASLNSYISDLKRSEFQYDYAKNEAESSKLRNSWIAPLQLNYSYSKSKPYDQEQTSQSAAIKMDQPIFQSGGIYYGIKFAQASRRYSDYSVDVAKRKMIKDTIALLMQIKEMELKENAQKLRIVNSDINLAQKREEYLKGQLDSGFVDNAIIQRNSVKSTLFDMQTSKEKLISKFKTMSDLNYKTAKIPHLELINREAFLKHNIVLKQNEAATLKSNYYKNVTVAKYLPKVSFTAGYNYTKTEGQIIPQMNNEKNYYDYGVRVSMPLNINTLRDIESAKVDYLKSQVLQEDKRRELLALFEQVLRNLKNYDKKIELSGENSAFYSKLLSDTKKLFQAGYKTKDDVSLLKNSLEIQNINAKVYEIEKQLELLNLYEMYINEGQ